MTKEEFIDWKNHSVTKEIYKKLMELIEEGRDELEAQAGLDPIQDAKRSGKLAGLRSVLEIDFND